MMERMVNSTSKSNKDILIAAIEKEWANIPEKVVCASCNLAK
jgi:rubredoxin